MVEEYVLDGGVNSEFINLSNDVAPVFSIVQIRKKILDPSRNIREGVDNVDIRFELLSLKCELKKESGVEKICFLPFELSNYLISEGDSKNIKTVTNVDRLLNNRHSYLFTFLIELDPL